MKNTLVIYRLSDNRVLHFAEQSHGLPKISDWDTTNFDSTTPLFDSSSMDYQVGVEVYGENDFDPETGLLTDTACAAYGINTGAKAKYIKDLAIDIPEVTNLVDDLVVTLDGGEIQSVSESLLSAAYRQTYLKPYLEFPESCGVQDLGTDPYTGLQLVGLPTTEGTSYIQVRAKVFDADGVQLTTEVEDTNVLFSVSRGKINGDRAGILNSTGEDTFRIAPPKESIIVEVSLRSLDIYAPGQEMLPGSLMFQIDAEGS